MFKLVLMLNFDGVIVGNYRMNFVVRDLNRIYKDLKKVCELFFIFIGIGVMKFLGFLGVLCNVIG